MDCWLINPPLFGLDAPTLQIPTLTGFLKKNSFRVTQTDLNALILDSLLDPKASDYFYNCNLTKNDSSLLEVCSEAKQVLRTENFYDIELFLGATAALDSTLAMVLRNCKIPFHGFRSIAELKKAAYDEQGIFETVVKDFLDDSRPKNPPLVIGITISYFSQVYPAILIAKAIREIWHDVHITCGGNIPTRMRLRESFMKLLLIFFDTLILFEGEYPLAELITKIQSGHNQLETDRLIIADKNTYPFEGWATPSYDGWPLEIYLAPSPVFSYLTSRGCPWNRCSFCAIPYNFRQGYLEKPVEMVINDLHELIRKYDAKFFAFQDLEIPPKRMQQLSNAIIDENIEIYSYVDSRISSELRKESFRQFYDAGFRLICYGVETLDDIVLRNMRKGITCASTMKVLNQSMKAGIWNYTYHMFGYPGTSLSSIHETTREIIANKDIFHSPVMIPFELHDWSPLYSENQDSEIIKNIKPVSDLSLSYRYEVTTGVSPESLEEIGHSLKLELKQVYPNYRLWNSATCSHLLLLSVHFGREYLTSLSLK